MKPNQGSIHPIGVFDSGIGGLSVANAIIRQLPKENLLYLGDSGRIPYGNQAQSTIKKYSFQITDYLLNAGCKAIVVACNTASAAALNELRKAWPDIPFIGMEPAVKPGAERTKTGKIGVLATAGTFSSERYESLTSKFATDMKVIENPCKGLVKLIEAGETESKEIEELLQTILQPMLQEKVDTFILGCTHYPFVESNIRKIIGLDKTIINPAPAVARQTLKVLKDKSLLNTSTKSPKYHFLTTGDKQKFEENLNRFFEANFSFEKLSLDHLKKLA